jgi:hypothetical protein
MEAIRCLYARLKLSSLVLPITFRRGAQFQRSHATSFLSPPETLPHVWKASRLHRLLRPRAQTPVTWCLREKQAFHSYPSVVHQGEPRYYDLC